MTLPSGPGNPDKSTDGKGDPVSAPGNTTPASEQPAPRGATGGPATTPVPVTGAGTGPGSGPNDVPGTAGHPTDVVAGSQSFGTAPSQAVHDPEASARTATVGSKIEEEARDSHREAQTKADEAAQKDREVEANRAQGRTMIEGLHIAHDNHVKQIDALVSAFGQGTPVSITQLQALQASARGMADVISSMARSESIALQQREPEGMNSPGTAGRVPRS